jgi:hypothetical protein
LNDRIVYLKKTANFMHKQLSVRDGVNLHVFIRHEGFDQFGNALPDDGSSFPGDRSKKKNGEDKKYA